MNKKFIYIYIFSYIVHDSAENFIYLADLFLVFEEDWCIEIRYLAAGGHAHQVALARMCKVPHFYIKVYTFQLCSKNHDSATLQHIMYMWHVCGKLDSGHMD